MTQSVTEEDAYAALRVWNLEQSIFVGSIQLGMSGAKSDYDTFVDALQDQSIADLAAPPTLGEAILDLAFAGVAGGMVSGFVSSSLQRMLSSRLQYVTYRINVRVPKKKRDAVVAKLRMGGAKASPHKKRKKIELNVDQIHNDGSLEHFLYTLSPSIADMLGSRVDELLQEDLSGPGTPPDWSPGSPGGFMERLNTWAAAKGIYNEQLSSYLSGEIRLGKTEEIVEHLGAQALSRDTDLVPEEQIEKSLTQGQIGYKQLGLAALFALHTRGQFGKLAKGSRTVWRETETFSIPATNAWSKQASAAADEIAKRLINPIDPLGRTFERWALDDMERFYDPKRTRITDKMVLSRQKESVPGKAIQQHRGAVAVYISQVYRGLLKGAHMSTYVASLR